MARRNFGDVTQPQLAQPARLTYFKTLALCTSCVRVVHLLCAPFFTLTL